MFIEEGMLMVFLLSSVWCTVGNEIGDEGAIRIAEGLEKNTSLKHLHIRGVFPPHSLFIHYCISYSLIS
jgi:hypothetical protein